MMETLIHSSAPHHRPKANIRHHQYTPQPHHHTHNQHNPTAASKATIREMKARQRDLETFGDDALSLLGPSSSKQQHAFSQPQPQQQQRRAQHQHHQNIVQSSHPSTPSKGKNASGASHRKTSSQDSSSVGDDSFSSASPAPSKKHNNKQNAGGKSKAGKSGSSPTSSHPHAQHQPATVVNSNATPSTPIKIPAVSSSSSPYASSFGNLPSFPTLPAHASGHGPAAPPAGIAYAGPRFHNSPSPADLPLPKFASKKLGAGGHASNSGPAAGLLSSSPSTTSFG